MEKYHKYMHVERLGTDEVCGILDGTTYIFPKIDGTNGHIWFDEQIRFGSRRRVLSIGESDNQGFMEEVSKIAGLEKLFDKHPDWHVFGEWLVPHTLKNYRDDTWRKFYVFDVAIEVDNASGEKRYKYIPYDVYREDIEKTGLDAIPPMRIGEDIEADKIYDMLDKNTYLMKDGCIGEGLVIKNYDFQNKYGRTVWAKLVRSEFKDTHMSNNNPPIIRGKEPSERMVAKKYLTDAMIDKVYAKITADVEWNSKYIPRLFGECYHDLIVEEIWRIVKDNKSISINFGLLNRYVIERVKECKADLF